MTDICKRVQPSIIAAFEAEPPSSPVQPDAGKQRLLAVSLLYTENTDSERPEPLLTVREVAHFLGLCTETVYRQCASGSLRHTKVAWAIRIARSDLEEFIDSRSLPVAAVASRRLLPSSREHDLAAPDLSALQTAVEVEIPTCAAVPGCTRTRSEVRNAAQPGKPESEVVVADETGQLVRRPPGAEERIEAAGVPGGVQGGGERRTSGNAPRIDPA
jgi:excisionase family DNA binding protein